jgi:RNA polymerase sigma factor (sigma-70 family)
MATNQLSRVLQTLRTAGLPDETDNWSDGQLLEAYVSSREEAVFAALVRRHGPMVWGVCRRLLHNHQDAEDAFQATFLVLVRKAPSLVPRDLVANWLYGVAHRTALKARATAAKRHGREKQVTAMPEPAFEQQELWDDVRVFLDQELARLPDKYRAVLVLCDLEGKTRREAARHLHVPEGTVATRLATARTMLARRLKRSGLVVSGGTLAVLLSQQLAAAGVPAAVASSTIQAATLFAAGQAAAVSVNAVALAEGVLKIMLWTKLKATAVVLLLAAALTTGAAALTHGVQDRPAPAQTKEVGATRKGQAERPTPKKEAEPIPNQVGGIVKGGDSPKEGRQVNGVVKAVDAASRTITVEGATYPVAPDAHISLDHRPGQLEDLPPGANVGLNLGVDQKTVLRVSANGSSDFGQVKAVDAATGTITVTGGPPEDRVYTVPPDAPITIDGRAARLADVPVGASLHALNLRVDQKTVSSINAVGPSFHRVEVQAVDAAGGTVTIAAGGPKEIASRTLAVAPQAGVEIDGAPGKLAGVPGGAFVNLRLSFDSQTVLHLQAEGPTLGGCGGSEVSAVDAANHTVTFAAGGPAEVAGKTFRVADNVWLQMDARPGKLADLPAGSYLNITLAVDRQMFRSIWATGPPVPGHGVVRAVDAVRHTVTVDDRTYPVAANANIVMDGRGGLATLPVGATVALRLCVDQKTVGTIVVQAK